VYIGRPAVQKRGHASACSTGQQWRASRRGSTGCRPGTCSCRSNNACAEARELPASGWPSPSHQCKARPPVRRAEDKAFLIAGYGLTSISRLTGQPYSPMLARWALRASCLSARRRAAAQGGRPTGSSRRTRRARRCDGKRKRIGAADRTTMTAGPAESLASVGGLWIGGPATPEVYLRISRPG
jgi:hypothetical protein